MSIQNFPTFLYARKITRIEAQRLCVCVRACLRACACVCVGRAQNECKQPKAPASCPSELTKQQANVTACTSALAASSSAVTFDYYLLPYSILARYIHTCVYIFFCIIALTVF